MKKYQMKKIKKAIIAIVALLMVFALMGCSKTDKPAIEEPKPLELDTPDDLEFDDETEEPEETEDDEGEAGKGGIPSQIIYKHCAPNVEEDDADYEFEGISANASRIEDGRSEKGREISLYWLDDTLYRINLEYFGGEEDRIVYSLDGDYATEGFTAMPDEMGIFQSATIRNKDKTIKVYIDQFEGSYDWDDDDTEVVVINDTITYKHEESEWSYIPMLLGVHDLAVSLSPDVEFGTFKLNSIEALDTFVGYDIYSDEKTGINDFTFTFPVSYGPTFANLMEISYKNSTDHTIINASFDDEDGPAFRTCLDEELKYWPMEYQTSLYFNVMDEDEFAEGYEQTGTTEHYIMYGDNNIYTFVPKDKAEYRLTNSIYTVPVSGVPCIVVLAGDKIAEEQICDIVEQFSFDIVKEIDYTDNYITVWD